MAKKLVTYRLDAEIVDALKKRAEADRRTITAVVELALLEYLEDKQ